MHAALLIDEVLREIFDFCYCDHYSRRRANLARLARTCRAWQDPALDKLWSRLVSLDPLLVLVNNEETAATALHSYACRIRHLSLTTKHLHYAKRGAPLLCNLRSLDVERHAWKYIPAIYDSLVSPTLKRLNLNITDSSSSAPYDLLSRIHLVSHDIQSITMRGPTCAKTKALLASMDSIRVCALKYDRTLEPSDVLAMSEFSSLTELRVDVPTINTDDLATLIKAHNIDCFPALKKLRLSASSALIQLILDSTTSRTLEHVHLDFHDRALSTAPWRNIFLILGQKATYTLRSLKAVHIVDADATSDITSGPVPEDMQFTVADLRPLAACSAMQSFTLSSTFSTTLRDADSQEMAKWWPSLERLDIDNLGNSESELTLHALVPFARACPNLQYLHLPGDASAVPATDVAGEPHRSLTSLAFGSLGDQVEAAAIAGYLDGLFPALTSLGDDYGGKGWKAVRAALGRPVEAV